MPTNLQIKHPLWPGFELNRAKHTLNQ